MKPFGFIARLALVLACSFSFTACWKGSFQQRGASASLSGNEKVETKSADLRFEMNEGERLFGDFDRMHAPEDALLTISLPPQLGRLEISQIDFSFQPPLNMNGEIVFRYEVRDAANNLWVSGRVEILVKPVNDAPMAAEALMDNLSDTDVDSDALTFEPDGEEPNE